MKYINGNIGEVQVRLVNTGATWRIQTKCSDGWHWVLYRGPDGRGTEIINEPTENALLAYIRHSYGGPCAIPISIEAA